MSFTTLLANSLIGFVLVFLVLLILMAFIAVMNKAFSIRESEKAPAAESAPAPAAKKEIPEVILQNVSERDAAMIMAIVADESGIPLEELRFISIREVKKDEV
ncbi:MAG: OadG family transporter subunit [Oscillospiraceae bacterium]|nr:OadG family transporter subunit [Oscillospiraceae bacterium]